MSPQAVPPRRGTRGPSSGGVPLLLCATFAVLLSGCSPPTSPGSEDVGRCAPPEQHPTTPGGHLLGDTPPPEEYSTVPPTSGWHTSAPPRLGVAQPPLSEPEQVAVLEQGGVVISYRGLPANERQRVRELAAAFNGPVAVTAYNELEDGTVALTAWGVLQRCDGVDTPAIERFLAAQADREDPHLGGPAPATRTGSPASPS